MTKKGKTILYLGAIVLFMGSASFLSVPFYNWFCKVTGYGGTVQEVKGESEKIIDTDIKIRFNSDVVKGLDLYFQPVKRNIITKIGKTNIIHYKVINRSNEIINAIWMFIIWWIVINKVYFGYIIYPNICIFLRNHHFRIMINQQGF